MLGIMSRLRMRLGFLRFGYEFFRRSRSHLILLRAISKVICAIIQEVDGRMSYIVEA